MILCNTKGIHSFEVTYLGGEVFKYSDIHNLFLKRNTTGIVGNFACIEVARKWKKFILMLLGLCGLGSKSN